MVTITDASLRNTTYETIYDTLFGNIGSYTSSSQPSIKASYTGEEKNLPEIVLYPIDVSEEDFNFGQANGSKEIRVMIEVYTKKMKDLENLAENISVLMTAVVAGLQLRGTDESTAFTTPNLNKLHQKVLTYTYVRK